MILVGLPLPIQALVKEQVHLPPGVFALLGWAVILASYVIYAALIRRVERRQPDEIALRALPADLAKGLLIGSGMFLLVMAALGTSGAYTIELGHWTAWWSDMRNALSGGFVEELIFRLVIFRILLRVVGVWPALTLSAAIFGAAHLINDHATLIAGVSIAIEAGLMLGSLYLLTGRVWMSVGVHAAWNFAESSVFGATMSGQAASGKRQPVRQPSHRGRTYPLVWRRVRSRGFAACNNRRSSGLSAGDGAHVASTLSIAARCSGRTSPGGGCEPCEGLVAYVPGSRPQRAVGSLPNSEFH
jgi:membrane protease YdiL (CAAX protease family)